MVSEQIKHFRQLVRCGARVGLFDQVGPQVDELIRVLIAKILHLGVVALRRLKVS